MAANQSLISVPIDVTDEDVLKRFLIRLVQLLDLQLGLRGDNPTLRAADLEESTEKLREALVKLVEGLDDRVESIEDIEVRFNTVFGVLTNLEDIKGAS